MAKLRTFICLQLDQTLRSNLETFHQELLEQDWPMRWISVGNIHLTLKFLGDTDQNKIDYIEKALQRAVQNIDPFSVKVKGVGVFPNPAKPRIFWIGLENIDNLITLQRKVDQELALIGFEPEKRKFRPHLTAGRVKRGKRLIQVKPIIDRYKDHEFGNLIADKVTLMQSDLQPTGAVYTPLVQISL
jgi:2'-5' RNA ligase